MSKNQNEEIKNEMALLQEELEQSLKIILSDIGKKLDKAELEAIKKEITDINELIERLKSGFIWIALFGKTSVGKSAIANALIGEDIATVGIEHDLTTEPTGYAKEPWMIVDVPGIMGEEVNELVALEEAKKAHGHIFVVDEEPLGPELKLFDLVSSFMQDAPRIVFVNKIDRLEHMPKKDKDKVIELIKEKMQKYVKSENDIVFGSAELYDSSQDIMVRQRLINLEDRLYEDAGTLGQIINVLDPAKKADDLTETIREKVLSIRRKVARKVIQAFAIAEIASSIVPFGSLLVTPGLLGSLTIALVSIMYKGDKKSIDKIKVTKDVLRVCGEFLAADFIAVAVADVVIDVLGLGIFGMIADVAGLSYFKYRRTLIFGEAMLIYIENGFTFGNDAKTSIVKAKQRASEHYQVFSKNRNK
jgi:GTPase Era involved in 16S rRNA processing